MKYRIEYSTLCIWNLILIVILNILYYGKVSSILLFDSSFVFILFVLIKDIYDLKIYKLLNVRVFYLLGVVFWYYLPVFFLDLKQSGCSDIIVINFSLMLVFLSKKYLIADEDDLRVNTKKINIILILYLLYITISSNGEFFKLIFMSREANKSWSLENNLNVSFIQSIISLLGVVINIAISYLFFYFYKRKNYLKSLLYLISVLLISIDTGFRTLFIFLIFPISLIYLEKFNVIKILIIVFFVFLFSKFLLINRNASNKDTFGSQNIIVAALQTGNLYSETKFVTDNNLRFKNIVQDDFVIYASYLIPRVIYENKPIPEVVRQFTLFKWCKDIKYESGNVFPGVFAIYYISYGLILGMVMFLIFNYMLIFVFDLLIRLNKSNYLVGLFCANAFLNFRSNSPYFYYHIIFAVILLFLLTKINFNINKIVKIYV